MRLPDPDRSRIVLIGTGTYRSPDLANVPVIANNIRDVHATLTCIEPDHRVVVPPDANAEAVGELLTVAAREAEDTLIVYYAGHGLLSRRGGELYLTLAGTDPGQLQFTALRFEALRDAFLDSPAVNRIVILDCCYSGRAIGKPLAADGDDVLGQLAVQGTYILTSAPGNRTARVLPGEPHTAFTHRLLRLLTDGIPDGPELLTLRVIYQHLLKTLAEEGLPRPQQCGTETADVLALAKNRRTPTGPVAPSRHRLRPLPRQSMVTCPHCHRINLSTDAVCVACGRELSAQPDPPLVSVLTTPNAEQVCPNCTNITARGMLVCPVCAFDLDGANQDASSPSRFSSPRPSRLDSEPSQRTRVPPQPADGVDGTSVRRVVPLRRRADADPAASTPLPQLPALGANSQDRQPFAPKVTGPPNREHPNAPPREPLGTLEPLDQTTREHQEFWARRERRLGLGRPVEMPVPAARAAQSAPERPAGEGDRGAGEEIRWYGLLSAVAAGGPVSAVIGQFVAAHNLPDGIAPVTAFGVCVAALIVFVAGLVLWATSVAPVARVVLAASGLLSAVMAVLNFGYVASGLICPYLMAVAVAAIVINRLHNTTSAGARKPSPGQAVASNGPSRNAPCPCGSGKKYKRCHGAPGDFA